MYEALEKMPKPAVIVMKDVSGAPHRVAYAGEVMATLAKRLGAVGMVTDGALRDVKEVRELGFHYFMKYPVVSHANFEILEIGIPVEMDGEIINTGDILHGDANGIVVVPAKKSPAPCRKPSRPSATPKSAPWISTRATSSPSPTQRLTGAIDSADSRPRRSSKP